MPFKGNLLAGCNLLCAVPRNRSVVSSSPKQAWSTPGLFKGSWGSKISSRLTLLEPCLAVRVCRISSLRAGHGLAGHLPVRNSPCRVPGG